MLENQQNKIDYILKFTGGAYLPTELDAKREHTIVGKFQIYSEDTRGIDNEIIYKARFIHEVAIETGKGIIMSKDRASKSKQMRWAIQQIHDQVGSKLDFEDFYSALMGKMTFYLSDIC